MCAIAILNQLKDAANRRQYPNVPDKARIPAKYSDKTTNGLTTCVTEFLRLKGAYVARVNTTGIIRKGKFTKGGGTVGASDLNAIINGRSVQIEIKAGKDKLSEAQIKQGEKIKAAGGVYLVVKDFESFYQWYCKEYEPVTV